MIFFAYFIKYMLDKIKVTVQDCKFILFLKQLGTFILSLVESYM
jgi:hypothetical protein